MIERIKKFFKLFKKKRYNDLSELEKLELHECQKKYVEKFLNSDRASDDKWRIINEQSKRKNINEIGQAVSDSLLSEKEKNEIGQAVSDRLLSEKEKNEIEIKYQ